MRTFVTCAILAATVLTCSAAAAQAHDNWHYYQRRPVEVIVAPPVLVRPAPIVVVPAPLVVAQPAVIVAQPAPVLVGPVFRPGISLRIGIGR